MKHNYGAMKYDIDEVVERDEFVEDEKSIILNNTSISRFKGVGPVAVSLRKGESIDSLLKRFKKGVIESNILTEYHEAMTFVKPSVKRRQKKINRKFKARRAELNKY